MSIEVVRFVFEEARRSMEDPWDNDMMNALLGVFETGHRARRFKTGDIVVMPEGSSALMAKMSEYRGMIFVEAMYPDDEHRFPTFYCAMATDQEKGWVIFKEATKALRA